MILQHRAFQTGSNDYTHYAFCRVQATKTPPIPADCSPAKLHLHFLREQLEQAAFVVRREEEAGWVRQGHGCVSASGWLSPCGVLNSLEQQESNQTATKILAILPSLTSAQDRNKALSNSAWDRKNSGRKSCLSEKDRVGNCWYAQELPTPENSCPFHWSLLPLYFTPKTVLLYQVVCSVLNWPHINMFNWESKCVWREVWPMCRQV